MYKIIILLTIAVMALGSGLLVCVDRLAMYEKMPMKTVVVFVRD